MHMTRHKDFLRDLKLAPNAVYVTYDNNSNSQIWGYDILTNDKFSVSNVIDVADLKHNLISVAQLTDSSQKVEFFRKHSNFMIEDRKECLIKSNCNNNMYPLDIIMIIDKPQLCLLLKATPDVSWLWH